MKKLSTIILNIYCLLLFACTNTQQDHSVSIHFGGNSKLVDFAVEDIKQALKEKGLSILKTGPASVQITLKVDEDLQNIEEEGYKVSRKNGKITVAGIDEAGVMYGGLELAEQIQVYGLDKIVEVEENPYMQMRGSKFNIPLDVRTPSYSDYSDAAQNNMIEMWNIDFWKEYIDTMAKYRYNFISLWSLNPFPSLIRTPGYEDIALDNVHKSKGPFNEYYNLRGEESYIPELVSNYEVIKEISMDKKIKFWQEVMAYGKSRNINFYVVTWNIFANGIDGKYGITEDKDNETTKDYVKNSLKQMFVSYPDLAGVGLTTGENMPDMSVVEKEEWAYDTYGKAVLEIADEMPDRKFTLIHRQHFANPEEIAKKFRQVADKENIEFIYSFKYAKAHVMSATKQPYHEEFVQNIGDLKTIWTLRNDDTFYFRWGAPDFVREFISNIPYDVSRGYYYGSDQWIWGREFTSKNVSEPRQIEVVKHWYNWMMWGRLGYNPKLSNDRFAQVIQDKFPEVDGQSLLSAWQEASMVYPVTTGFHWGSLDFRWYIEGCRSNTTRSAKNETGFHDVNIFINQGVHDYSGCQTIPDYVKMVVEKGTSTLTSPFGVSEKLHAHCEKALKLISQMSAGENKELKATLTDIKTISYLGKYYAHKIAGSTNVALYRETRDKKYQKKAIEELTSALEFWKSYANLALDNHVNPLWTNRVGYVDWAKTTEWVADDIEIAKAD